MSVALGIGGWLLAVTGIGAAALTRVRLARHAEAVARACHEVRGPLTAVGLGLEPAAHLRHLSPARLGAIALELDRARVALDDLAGARRHSVATRVELVDVAALVATSVEAWRPVAAAQGAAIKFETPRQPLLVSGDRLRLAQAVGNLLANAIEHGGEAIEVRLHGAPGTVRIEVHDDGPGLPVPLDQLVVRRPRRSRAERGHGLGIACRVAVAHGGRLGAASSRGGTRLVLELPQT